jgi:hypothetical protein
LQELQSIHLVLLGIIYFFDPEHPYLNGRIKVNDNSDATRNVKM